MDTTPDLVDQMRCHVATFSLNAASTSSIASRISSDGSTRRGRLGAMRGRIEDVLATRVTGDGERRRPDKVVVEEPLEIRLDGELVTITMRTPGHDFELAVGFCHGEGLLDGATVQQIRYCATGSALETNYNTVSVDTDVGARGLAPRLTTTTAACGVCGSQSIDDLTARLSPLAAPPELAVDVVARAAAAARAQQATFDATGAVHAAAAYTVDAGDIVVLREDIGRHNAVDKVVGRLRLDGGLASDRLALFVSGRASFEMVQKAWAAGFSWVTAVGGVSSLAIQTARAGNVGLAGFVRDGSMTVYAP
jgi:FdhD protein